ncbi:hypothetical protein FJZ40_04580 [Candidatus Shapirobacteria bacterium]|nr:hypothetical protein [Candidatus Shapirobacteria bacterium]
MAARNLILATGETYHVLNHSVGETPIFKGERECSLFLEAMKFYLQPSPIVRFSKYRLNRARYPINLSEKLVTILNYCLMPSHFHFTLRQEKDNGIKQFTQRLSSSFAHYFNLKHKNKGHLFATNFKAVRIENDNQLLHLSRYIHLNPVTAYLMNSPMDYPYSSYRIYLGKDKSEIIDPQLVLDQVGSSEKYEEFTLSQIDYQRSLQQIKHLLLEE